MKRALIVVSFLAGLTACPFLNLIVPPGGSDAGSDDDSDAGNEMSAFDVDRYVAGYSNVFVGCTDEMMGFMTELEPAYLDAIFNSEFFAEVARSQILAMLESPHLRFNQAKHDACLSFLESNPSCDMLDDGDVSCADIFDGLLADGDVCTFGEECPESSSCYDADADDCGVCTPRVGGGASCESADCVSGFSCLGDQVKVCVDRDTLTRSAAGDPCETGDECGSPTQSGLVCVEQPDGSNLCTQIVVVPPGGTCQLFGFPDANHFCRDGLLGDYYCDQDIYGGATEGSCVERPSVGEACNGYLVPCKTSAAYCDDGTDTCVAGKTEGETCDPDHSVDQCLGGALNCNEASSRCAGLSTDPPVLCD